jgi:hypothetical protein
MNLYDLTSNYLELLAMAEQYDEEAVKETLEGLEDSIQVKLENIVYVIREIENKIDAITKEEKRLAEYKGSYNKTISHLKTMIQNNVEVIGEPAKKGSSVTLKIGSPMLKSIRVQDNPPSLNVLDPEKVPDKFKEPQPDKIVSKEILKAIKDGEKIEGVEVIKKRGVRFS